MFRIMTLPVSFSCPPEYISGNPCCKSDAWSLGMTLYELAEDKNPYRGSMTAVVTQRACDK